MNVARGKHIVTEDLVEALRITRLRGTLDVTYPEPLQLTTLVESAELFDYTAYGKHTEMGIKLLSSRVTENVSDIVRALTLLDASILI